VLCLTLVDLYGVLQCGVIMSLLFHLFPLRVESVEGARTIRAGGGGKAGPLGGAATVGGAASWRALGVASAGSRAQALAVQHLPHHKGPNVTKSDQKGPASV
jgi:hypothetical protein